MNSLSAMVLVWLFGTWAFGGAGLPDDIMSAGTKITPLVIFASIFTTVGLAMFGLLGSWAIFLGIFRLRQNGNFFGARDGNESFFYPIRMVLALTLCAPVIPVDGGGGQTVVLTPGHSLIAAIARSGSSWGDTAQSASFRAMHSSNMFGAPEYNGKVDTTEAREMLSSWTNPALQAAGYMVTQNPNGVMAGESPNVVAQKILEASWAQKYPFPLQAAHNAAAGPIDPFILSLVTSVSNIPPIPPTDEVASALATKDALLAEKGESTTTRELDSESYLCVWSGWDALCSDEYAALRDSNTRSLAIGLAEGKRQMWARMFTLAYQRHMALQAGGLTGQQDAQFRAEYAAAVQETADWYAKEASTLIRDKIAKTNIDNAEQYFKGLEQWGWMMGGTFVLRAANDFSRAQSYAEGATAAIAPNIKLSSLTTGDDLTKIAMGPIEADSAAPGWLITVGEFFGLDILMANPARANIYTVSQFGRDLAGAGIMTLGGGGAAKKLFKADKTGAVMTAMGWLMLAAGAMVGYVMPIVFAIYGIMGVISWLTFVASAFFGVTLWSAAFAAPKGEEHTSQMAAKGWNMLIFIGLYPALAVGGLAAAVTITSLGLPLVNILMAGIWGMSDNGVADLSQPFDAIAGALIGILIIALATCMLFWSVCMTSASLLTTFPRTVLNMVSFSEPGLNPYENTSQGIMGNITGMIKMPIATAGRQAIASILNRKPSDRNGGGGSAP